MGTSAKYKQGYKKIEKSCIEAQNEDIRLDFVWVDTCCIDKTNSTELSEAINSMYLWYQEAEVCYVHLADVPSKKDFTEGRWFTRGWTLQELIAPRKSVFFDENWNKIEYTAELQKKVSEVTGIPISILSKEKNLEDLSVAQRMSWAANRQTTRIEDHANCLLGIFGVNMPLIYGEKEDAFIRLQEEIIRVSDDLSLFAWRSKNETGLLPRSPTALHGSRHIVHLNSFDSLYDPPTVNSRGVHLSVRFVGIGYRGLGLAIIDCKEMSGTGNETSIAIYVRDVSLKMRQFIRVQTDEFRPIDLRNSDSHNILLGEYVSNTKTRP